MLPEGDCLFRKSDLSPEEVKRLLASGPFRVIANPSHEATFALLEKRYTIELKRPSEAVTVRLKAGDSLVVAQVCGLSRLREAGEYPAEALESAEIRFILIERVPYEE